jgi:alpha-ketoglutarate-dependent taurine dioxygenase
VSQRGVLFFRNQSIDSDQQKVLGQKLGELTGKPESSKVLNTCYSGLLDAESVDSSIAML